MTSPFTKPSDLSGSSFFKPAEYESAIALLVEPKSVDKDVENTYKGKTTLRDEVIADITVFSNSEDLEKGNPSDILKSTRVTHTMLTGSLVKIIGGATVAIVRKIDTKSGSGYVFRDPENGAEDHVFSYYENREAAAAEAPDFDD